MNSSFLDFQMFAYPKGQNSSISWQGEGKAGVLVLHNSGAALPEIEESFLGNILKAVKLDPLNEQVYLSQCNAQHPLALALVAPKYNVQHVLLFGVEPAWAGIRAQLPYYQFTKLGGFYLLRAHSVTQIREERQANKNENAGALWNALKAKFL
ncbi:MAG: hypothetical protein AAFP77_17285 [Bacteroidota bacterium]